MKVCAKKYAHTFVHIFMNEYKLKYEFIINLVA